MTIELSNFFNNPTLIELGPLKIQYYAMTWLLSAFLIYVFLKNNSTIKEIGLNKDEVNDMVFCTDYSLERFAVEESVTCSSMVQNS